jgi:hypothetical protein
MKTFWNAFALRTVWDSFFMNDAHFIVSRHGREILAKMQQKEALIELMNIDLVKGKETLEEAAENYMNKKGHIPTTDLEDAIFKQGFLDGAKWQQERMYSEIDLEVAFFEGRENSLTFIEWFEQFKKKHLEYDTNTDTTT